MTTRVHGSWKYCECPKAKTDADVIKATRTALNITDPKAHVVALDAKGPGGGRLGAAWVGVIGEPKHLAPLHHVPAAGNPRGYPTI